VAVAIVAGAFANKPFSGGEAWVRLSWALGLRRLGFEVWFVERLGGEADPAVVAYFEEVTEEFGLTGRATLLEEGQTLDEEIVGEAEVLFDLSGHLGAGGECGRTTAGSVRRHSPPAPRRRVYVDLDPGFTQVWHADPSLDFDLGGYDHYVTVGLNVGRPGCAVPTGEIDWIPTLPPVVLDEWPQAASSTAGFRFTTVATWRSPYGSVEIDGRAAPLKHHEFRRFLDLPSEVEGAEFELALDIHPGDRADLDALLEAGWKVVPPREVAASPAAFRDYLRGSEAEFSVAQGAYVDSRSGWFSDRSAAYLASGRPVLVQDTGVEELPTGEGLLTFSSPEEAVAGARRILADPAAHAAAARRLAEEHLDSDRVLGRLLDLIGVGR
jgi:hypothetical protein